jgi:apolipoprotein N-acyltransferase
MRVPSFERFQKFMQVTAFFICGVIVGSAVYSAMRVDIVDHVIQENIKLQDQLESIKNDLKEANKVRKENVIRNIVTIIESPQGKPDLDILTETALKKALKKDLSVFLGRSIYDINSDSDLAHKLLNKKIYDHIEDKDYEVSTKTILVVDGVLQVWGEAKIHIPK